MESLKELYKIGPGPSSSHTIGPKIACLKFKETNHDADHFEVELYGSLSLTGRGHFTDQICLITLGEDKTKVVFFSNFLEEHPNTFILKAFKQGNLINEWKVLSVGGGSIKIVGHEDLVNKEVYQLNSFDEIYKYCLANNFKLEDYIYSVEPEIKSYLDVVLDAMFVAIERGILKDGLLPGKLKFPRMAKIMFNEGLLANNEIEKQKSLITAYAFGVAEENASMGEVVTAPTLGSCGVLPAVLYYYAHDLHFPHDKIINALAIGGLFGNLVKYNATISGAEGGCQAEIGVACAMASAATSYLMDLDINQIGYAAEIGLEHHLGLTCDPVGGYVIIPCIERNGVAALRSLDAAHYAKTIGKYKANFVSFDIVVKTMKSTGTKIPMELKETSLAGLASEVVIK